MTKEFFIGKANNTAKKPSKILVGNSSNIAKEVKSIFVGNSSNQAVKVFPNFPDIYQKCEYICNTNGTEYILLNYAPNSNTRVVIDFQFYNQGFYDYQRFIISCGNTWGVNYYYRDYGTNHYREFHCNFKTDTVKKTYSTSADAALFERHTVDFNRSGGYFYLDDALIGSSQVTFSSVSTYKICLFGYGTGIADYPSQQKSKANLYSCKIYQNNQIIYDLVPCYLKADPMVVGMYDIANGQFYGNNGAGIFYKGPDVN